MGYSAVTKPADGVTSPTTAPPPSTPTAASATASSAVPSPAHPAAPAAGPAPSPADGPAASFGGHAGSPSSSSVELVPTVVGVDTAVPAVGGFAMWDAFFPGVELDGGLIFVVTGAGGGGSAGAPDETRASTRFAVEAARVGVLPRVVGWLAALGAVAAVAAAMLGWMRLLHSG